MRTRSGHGSASKYSQGCRCDPCTAANTELAAMWRSHQAERKAKLKRVGPFLKHGSIATYNDYGCRCDPCVAAKARSRKAAR